MSIAGTTSTQGDEYQLQVALHWFISLYLDSSIDYIQIESNGIPASGEQVFIDDVVIEYSSAKRKLVQAKKNEPKYSTWSFSDQTMQEELVKGYKQYLGNQNIEVWFFSRSPFGKLQQLSEGVRKFATLALTELSAPKTVLSPLEELSYLLSCSKENAFSFAKVLFFDCTQDWNERNEQSLDFIVPQHKTAKKILERFLTECAAKLNGRPYTITREDFCSELQKHNLVPAPKKPEQDILKIFTEASKLGRHWQRAIGEKRIPLKELDDVVCLIDHKVGGILVTGQPGAGKTCFLLELADRFERDPTVGVLFIKGDMFAEASSEDELTQLGLPKNIVGSCARLAEHRKVIVLIDSLDVLSLNRSHSALNVFLSIVDRLSAYENVTVIAACRTFDLKYDSRLKNREWQKTISIQELDYQGVVRPILEEWNVCTEKLNDELKALLCVPQQLSLFKGLLQSENYSDLYSAWGLFERYIYEVIEKDAKLGYPALEVMYNLASFLLEERKSYAPRTRFQEEEHLVQKLISQRVIFEQDSLRIGFSHQTLVENLIVRQCLANGISLRDFILRYPPLPFIRPVVQTFSLYLRVVDRKKFYKSIRVTLQDENVAHHLKRLLVESFAEKFNNSDEDWQFFKWLFRTNNLLARHCVEFGQQIAWFDLIEFKLIGLLSGQADCDEWEWLVISKISTWLEDGPERVVAFWYKLLTQFLYGEKYVGEIARQLDKISVWHIEGVQSLFEKLLELSINEHDFLGSPLSHWIDATNQGDELLWTYITKHVPREPTKKELIENNINCEPHDFYNETFLSARLLNSDCLLDLTIDSIEEWSRQCSPDVDLRSVFLHDTEWERVHSKREMYHFGKMDYLFRGVQKAMEAHAVKNSCWWQRKATFFREVRELGLIYLLINCYIEAPQNSIEGIEHFLMDERLLNLERFSFELGQLMNVSYPYLSVEVAEKNQQIILSKRSNESHSKYESLYYNRMCYNYLVWIPCLYRTEEVNNFIDKFKASFGYQRQSPDIYSRGGMEHNPFDYKIFNKLSYKWILKIISHYNDKEEHPFEFVDNLLVGGKRSVLRCLAEAVTDSPLYLLDLIPVLLRRNIDPDFISALYEGVAWHIRYRFGRFVLANGEKRIFESEPSTVILWQRLKEGIELDADFGISIRTKIMLLDAVVILFKNEASAKFVLVECENVASKLTQMEERSYLWGELIEVIWSITKECLESGYDLFDEVFFLLQKEIVNVEDKTLQIVLRDLPYVIYKSPSKGWSLFDSIMTSLPVEKWHYAIHVFFYTYKEKYEFIMSYLDKMRNSEETENLKSYGQVISWMYLDNIMSKETFFASLIEAQEDIITSVLHVAIEHLPFRTYFSLSESILLALMQEKNLGKSSRQQLSQLFVAKKDTLFQIPQGLVLSYLNCMEGSLEQSDLYQFRRWLGKQVNGDPLKNLEYLEKMVMLFKQRENSLYLGYDPGLIDILREILIEVDMLDDPDLIQRAITIQDELVKIKLAGITDLYDDYSSAV